MIKMIKSKGVVAYNVNEYVCDDENDILDLPLNIGMGSVAFIINSGKYYIKNSTKWVQIPDAAVEGGGSSGGSGSGVVRPGVGGDAGTTRPEIDLPVIGNNGNWFVNGVDTGISVAGSGEEILTTGNVDRLTITSDELNSILNS